VDDLVDVEQTAAHAGKRTGKDAEAGKLTYPAVYGVTQSRAEVERLRRAALEALSGLGEEAEPLRAVCNFLAVRTK
jgi:geranylgeranyl pyrophosphate synthase